MNILITMAVALIATASTIFGVYNYVPQDILSVTGDRLGATVTTIAGTDTLSSSRSVINTNFSNLNTELGTVVGTTTNSTITTLSGLTTASSLASIGTITTGTWNGDAIGVGYGGTGTTSPTASQVMFGNGASGFQVIGFGTNGQFLTSGGAATLPTWTTSSINQASAYNWTGLHDFAATTSLATTTVNGARFTATFGGDGSDGALSVSSGTTDIDLEGQSFAIFNYSSISITGTGAITFSNPHTAGTVVLWRSQGDVNITSSATRAVDLRGIGASGGSGGTGVGGAGSNGTAANFINDTASNHNGLLGSGGSGGTGGSAGSASTVLTATSTNYDLSSGATYMRHSKRVSPGSGGAGGGAGSREAGGSSSNGGTGGRGGGAMIIESGGFLNLTGTIDISGNNGTNGSTSNDGASGGGGGGGAVGMLLGIYNELTSSSFTCTQAGGVGGDGGSGGSSGNAHGGGGGGSGGASGGAGGAGGAGGNDASNGSNGSAGSADGGGGGGGGGQGADGSSGGTGGAAGASTGHCFIGQNTQF